uniref:Uncharacterized protein n=1 Tax=Meloidogyne enterolobii TaxID=390850 RepID=A0A6V7VKX9_MELEN|nr:unnamed protein product [Meloidogyne enterolobii]
MPTQCVNVLLHLDDVLTPLQLAKNSSISLNTSYQSLLFSPLICCPDQCVSVRSRSSTCCSECEADTPPTNESEFVFSQQQQQNKGQDENHRSKRVSVCHCNCQQLLIQQKRQQRQRRSHSAVVG